MGLVLDYGPWQTPLDPDEMDGLLPPITTRGELDELEQANIITAMSWSSHLRTSLDSMLTMDFLCRIHEKMFGDVWQWAGTFRRSNKNIGVDWNEIPIRLRETIDDCRYWIDHETFGPDETAVRFKHRIVSVHPFANGNGRNSRLAADILIHKHFGQPVFSWGSNYRGSDNETRRTYLDALRSADAGNYEPLILFARS